MQKEVFFAIIVGSVLGILVAYGVWRTNSTLSSRDKTKPDIAENQHKETENIKPSLGVVTPANLSVVTNSPIVITGIANNLHEILVSTNEKDYLITTVENEFNQEVELTGGLNQIIVSGFVENKVAADEHLQVAFTTQIDSSEPLRATVGVITDITEDYLQLRNQDGEISQVGLIEETSYANNIGDPEEIEFTDLAIGDFIIAMGKISELEALEALRVIVTTEPDKLKLTTAKGKVTDYSTNSITLDNSKEYEYDKNTVFMDTNADNADFFLKEGQEILIVGTPILRSVFLL